MLVIGGIILLMIEYFRRNHDESQNISIDDLSIKQSFIIGLFQSISMVPGTSRSGATIIVTGKQIGRAHV